jgi:hypothetical protein
MPLPLEIRFGIRVALGSIQARAPRTPVMVKLPARPDAVELDPRQWVLSEDC